MQFPKPRFVEIVILGALLDGEVPGESLRQILREEFGWADVDQRFFMIIGRMKKYQWITIHKQVASTQRLTRQESSYAITDAGRAQWTYSLAFCRKLCDRWQDRVNVQTPVEMPTDPIKTVSKKRRDTRLPTLEETALILSEAPEEFSQIFKLAVATGKCILALSAIQIAEVDRTAWIIDIPGADRGTERSTFAVPEFCRRDITTAISRRRTGAVFLTGSGLRWTEANLRMNWRRIKTKLRLPQETVMPSARFLERQELVEATR